ncbi:MAG: ArsA-related P-loop ATPase [Candidatus Thiodiazotropha sp.]
MKIAFAGKGGVGKTTLTSLLAYHYSSEGREVLAIDADPSPCLGPALGFPGEVLDRLSPIAEMRDLIAKRTGSDPKNSAGGFFKINPHVSDLPGRFSARHNGIQLLLLGAVEQGGSGCICPSSALLKQLVNHVLVEQNGVVLLDLYAGVEHLGRGTAESVDAMLIVAEPTNRSMVTARQAHGLARDIGIENIYLVGNKANGDEDARFFADAAKHQGMEYLTCLPAADTVRTADRSGEVLYSLDENMADIARSIASRIEPGDIGNHSRQTA